MLSLTWLAATVAAVVLAWAGVRLVVDQVVQPLPPSVTEVAMDGLAASPPVTASPSPSPSPSPSVADGVGDDAGDDPASSDTEGGARSGPSPSTSSSAAPAAATTRTYALTGGTVTIEFSSARVRVLVATPNAGFSREIEQHGTQEVSVRFESDAHRSRLDAGWDDGEPDVEIREEPRDGDDGDGDDDPDD